MTSSTRRRRCCRARSGVAAIKPRLAHRAAQRRYGRSSPAMAQVACGEGNVPLPFDSVAQSYAAGNPGPPSLENVTVGGTPLRQLTLPVTVMGGFGQAESAALQLARPLEPVRNVLAELRLVLFLLCAGGIALAACLGRLAARRVLAPLAEVAADRPAHHRHRGSDEPDPLPRRRRGRAARHALQRDDRAVAELPRSARRVRAGPAPARGRRLARAPHPDHEPEDEHRGPARRRRAFRGGPAPAAGGRARAERGAQRADRGCDRARPWRPTDHLGRGRPARSRRRRLPDSRSARLPPDPVRELARAGDRRRRARSGSPARSTTCSTTPRTTPPPAGVVEVIVDGRGLRVRDHGTGIDPADLPYVFDRFYRGANSRHRQGSGLGLAIVRQVAVQHGGSVEADNAPDGGAVFVLRLPTLAEDQLDQSEAPLGASGDPLSLR